MSPSFSPGGPGLAKEQYRKANLNQHRAGVPWTQSCPPRAHLSPPPSLAHAEVGGATIPLRLGSSRRLAASAHSLQSTTHLHGLWSPCGTGKATEARDWLLGVENTPASIPRFCLAGDPAEGGISRNTCGLTWPPQYLTRGGPCCPLSF